MPLYHLTYLISGDVIQDYDLVSLCMNIIKRQRSVWEWLIGNTIRAITTAVLIVYQN